MIDEIKVEISSDAWVKETNSYMNIPAQFKSFFPEDCFIPRGTGRANAPLLPQRGIFIEYEGASEPIQCFMEERESGNFRPSNRGAIKAFYKASGAKAGDVISFSRKAVRTYRVTLLK